MSAVAVQEIERFVHPRVETRLQMPRDFLHDVLLVAQPHELRARRRRPDRVFTLFAVITVFHDYRLPQRYRSPSTSLGMTRKKGPAEAEPFVCFEVTLLDGCLCLEC